MNTLPWPSIKQLPRHLCYSIQYICTKASEAPEDVTDDAGSGSCSLSPRKAIDGIFGTQVFATEKVSKVLKQTYILAQIHSLMCACTHAFTHT